MKNTRLPAVGALLTAALAVTAIPATASAAKATGTKVSVRVEGLTSTVLGETTVTTKAATIVKDGKSADACEGDTAAVALQDATKGNWTAGTFSTGLGYPVVGIKGVQYPFTSSYYWSFWVNDKPATTGICGAKLKAGDQLLFFPQCSSEQESGCPEGNFDPPVLSIGAPKQAKAGKALTLKVSALANFTGKPSPASGAKVTAAGHTLTTSSSGKVKLTFAKAGSYRVSASATGSIRDELVVKVH